MEYHFRDIEKKWQAYWAKNKTFAAKIPITTGQGTEAEKPKYYVLDMFPYPSGAGLHVGHPLGYIASDIMARYKRHKGFNVLHPMGYDSFGLPAEQYAIQTGQHPVVTTEQNINRYREQLDKIGFSFDWDREVRTSDPNYYKWTQWIFIQLFHSWYNTDTNKAEPIATLIEKFRKSGHTDTLPFAADWKGHANWDELSGKEQSDVLMSHRIAYLGEAYVNWCPALGTVLANDEVKDGVSERGGHPVERKLMKQWSMRITAYAQRLLEGLDTIDWPESLKESQRNWIGRSEGTSLKFRLIPGPSPKEKGEDVTENKKQFWQTADPAIYDILKQFARNNRQPQTEAEDKLWQAIRNSQLGAKFRRQHPIGTYIADFICLEKQLIIEIDGEIHDQTKEQDERRTAALNQLGFEVIRFSNKEVREDLDHVTQSILKKLASTPLPGRGEGGEACIEVFTTRPDTIFGVSFVTLAPEHELVEKITTPEQKKMVDAYVTASKNRSERERQADVTKISGVFTGAYVEHPFSGKDIPVWVGDYVLAGYGTGAVMAVPAHDERDFKFANYFKLPIVKVIEPNKEHAFEEASWDEKEGTLVNSDFLNGLDVRSAIKKAIVEIERRQLGKGKVNFRLRDAVFGRQRYWGEPIPIFYKDGIPHALPDSELPLILPEVDKYLPTEDGEPPLARAKNWKYKGQYDYEHTTMPGWAGSSWYFLRYMDPGNAKAPFDNALATYWKEVDLYIGGSEHATGHLLYVRFWTKFLKDLGYISIEEPAKKLINQGMIQGRSNFVYRLELHNHDLNSPIQKNIFVSKDILDILIKNNCNCPEYEDIVVKIKEKYNINIDFKKNGLNFTKLNVDVNIVNNDVLDIEKFKLWRPEIKEALFGLNSNGEYICGVEVEKMSKSKYNVVSPDDICERFGADTLRLYEMFLGPLEQSKPWNTNGITGVHGFLKKLWRLFHGQQPSLVLPEAGEVKAADLFVSNEDPTKAELKSLHKTIKKITEDIDRFSFNTSVSNFMICVNELTELKCNKRAILEPLLVILSPYAPHITEELWSQLGHSDSISTVPFPICNEAYLQEDNFNYPVSFNGKMRFQLELPVTLPTQDIEKMVMEHELTKKYLEGKTPKKVIIVPKKIVNIVV